MSTNTDTVLKLSEALTELIGAYEKLQKENDDLNAKNKELEEQLNGIQKDKESLESTFNELNESNEKQETNINSMLGKIESLLGVNKSSSKKELKDIVIEEPTEVEQNEAKEIEENIFNTPVQHESSDVSDINIKQEESSSDLLVSNEEKTNKETTEEDDNKLDLNRMASLLNGFNK